MECLKTHAIVVVIIGALAAAWGGGEACGAATDEEVAKAVANVRDYDYGLSRKPLAAVEKLVAQAGADPALRVRLELELAKAIESSANLAAKQFVCRQLWIIGTDASVPAIEKMLAGADANVVEIACYALNRHPAPAVGAALRGALAKARGAGLAAVVNLLGDRRDAACVEVIYLLARGPDAVVADAAIAALGKIATAPAVEVLAELRKHKEADRRAAAVLASLQAARELGTRGKPAEAMAICEELGRPDQPLHVRRGALLCRVDLAGPGAASLVLATLRGQDEPLKAAAIDGLRAMPGENVTRLLAEQLPSLAARQQVLLIGALVDRGDPAARGAILRAEGHGDGNVRIAAIRALGTIGDASCVAVLAKAAAEAGSDQAKAAETSLRVLRAEGVDEAILTAMTAARGDLRVGLIGVLADRRWAPAAAALLKEAASQDEAISRAAFKALAPLADPKDLPSLVSLLVGLTNDAARNEAENAVVAAAGRVADQPRRAEAVLAALDSAKRIPARCSLLRVLGRIGGDRAYRAGVAAIADNDDQVRDAAVRALADWPDIRAMEPLLKILNGSGSDTHRVLALRGYLRLLKTAQATPAELVGKYAGAWAVARRADERKLILSGLGNVAHVDAMNLAADGLRDESVRSEAALAAIAIARLLPPSDGEAVNAAMGKVIEAVDDTGIRDQAKALIRTSVPQ